MCSNPIVRVEWIDSCDPAATAELDRHEIPDCPHILQAGFLIRENELSVSVAGAWKPETETFDYVITIPRFAIKKMDKLT